MPLTVLSLVWFSTLNVAAGLRWMERGASSLPWGNPDQAGQHLDMLADVESADAGEMDIGRIRLDWMVRRQRG